MTDLIKSLYQLTDELLNHLQNKPAKDQREEFIDRINYFLVEREKVLDGLKQYDKSEITLNAEFRDKDKEIGRLLQAILTEIQEDIKQIKNLQLINNQYGVNNKSFSADGMFFDKRK